MLNLSSWWLTAASLTVVSVAVVGALLAWWRQPEKPIAQSSSKKKPHQIGDPFDDWNEPTDHRSRESSGKVVAYKTPTDKKL